MPPHESPYPGPPGRIVSRARRIREGFDLLWPIILAIIGLVVFVVLLLNPELGSPPVYVVVGGMLTGSALFGLGKKVVGGGDE